MGNTEFPVLHAPSSSCILASTPETLIRSFPDEIYVLADIYEPEAEQPLLALEQQLGQRLLVPEVWRNVLQTAGILISSSLSGGTLRDRFAEADLVAPGRCWLRLENLRMRFSLPCPDGCGTPLAENDLAQILSEDSSFYSPELCCRYCYDLPDSIVLYDTAQTQQEKLTMAAHMGFCGAVLLDNGPSCP